MSAQGREFAILSGASAVSQVGSMSVAAAGPLLALAITGSPIAAGCVTAASVLPGLLLHVPAGLLVDRISRSKVMWTSQVVRLVSAIVAFSWLACTWDSVLILVIAALIDGACSVFYEVAEIATVPDLVSKKSLNLAIGSNEAKLNASMLFGRPLGGALLAVNPIMPWLVTVCTSLFSILALLTIRRSKHRNTPKRPGADAPSAGLGKGAPAGKAGAGSAPLVLRAVLGRLLKDPISGAVLAVCVLANFFFQVVVLLQILLAEQKGLPSYLVGVLLACSGVGGFLGALISPLLLRHISPTVSVIISVIVWVPLAWFIALSDDPVVGLAMWGACSIVGALINVALRTHQAHEFPNALLGSVTGITRFLSVGAVALGAFSGGWIIRFLGIRGTGLLIGTAFTVIAVVLLGVLHFPAVRSALPGAWGRPRKAVQEAPRTPAGPEHGVAGEADAQPETWPGTPLTDCPVPAANS